MLRKTEKKYCSHKNTVVPISLPINLRLFRIFFKLHLEPKISRILIYIADYSIV